MSSMVDVVIPVCRPDGDFTELLKMLARQTIAPGKVVLMVTDTGDSLPELQENLKTEIITLTPEEFDHAGTRNRGFQSTDADYVLFMTQDAVPRDDYFIETLLSGFLEDDKIKASFARQLPKKDCKPIERLTRSYNYPRESKISSAEDIGTRGIKTFFLSDVACMYERGAFLRLGGFDTPAIFNEDMLFAHKAITAGYRTYYNGEACVYHSHNLSLKEYFKRNFDLGASQAMHPEVFETVSSESEGKKMFFTVTKKLVSTGRWYLIPLFVLQCAAKFIGYRKGKNYEKYDMEKRRKYSQNRYFWKE